MTLAELLISEPQREKGGETANERYDYQALWGLALIFKHHASGQDYALAFEFHDDILQMNSSSDPTLVKFYQVKTKDKGHWTLTDLTYRKLKKPPANTDGGDAVEVKPVVDNSAPKERLPSFIGRLFANYLAFPDHTESLHFASNLPCEFISETTEECTFSECEPKTFAKFLKKLQSEHPEATEENAKIIHYTRADLSLHDASTHLKGKLNEFVTEHIGSVMYNPDALYTTVVEECRSKSKYVGAIPNFGELIRRKSITRSHVEGWLDTVRSARAVPAWEAVSAGLALDGLELAKWSRLWAKYRASALDPGNEGVSRIRARIRSEILALSSEKLAMMDLVSEISKRTISFALSNMSPMDESTLKVMALYEVYAYDPAGDVQEVDPQPKDSQA
ncbi:dsDNA nuclease domain-containing protein [Caulobacter sp. 602-1]|uniref:dsDNA nuclease domain-containing protein n=1 Tax=Caulobacter sp. 602-1 TaxID=2492472 RepID=UPI00131509B9|nr:dsDNA nuclease domain-containing protein [Caulobacter sp. 602-1]